MVKSPQHLAPEKLATYAMYKSPQTFNPPGKSTTSAMFKSPQHLHTPPPPTPTPHPRKMNYLCNVQISKTFNKSLYPQSMNNPPKCEKSHERTLEIQKFLKNISRISLICNIKIISQPATTCLKLTIETLEQGMKYVQS